MGNRFSNKNVPSNFSSASAVDLMNNIAFSAKDQYFVYLSSNVGASTNTNEIEDANKILQNTVILSRITPADVSLVARRSVWNYGDVYWRWSSSGQKTGERNMYALNKTNNKVYLCIRGASNPYWRKDLEGTSSFTSVPNGNNTKSYKDESIWKPLYKIDQSKDIKFSGSYMPFEDPDTTTSFSLLAPGINKQSSFSHKCPRGSSETGTCCLYHKTGYYDEVAGISYSSGDFYSCDCTKCYHCVDMAERMDMDYRFSYHGNTGSTSGGCIGCHQESFPDDCGKCACSIEPSDFRKVLEGSFKSTGTFLNSGTMHDLINNDDVGGELISMFINLSGLSRDQLLLNGTTPSRWKLNISSRTGRNADWRISYYTEDGGKSYYASGLTKISGGYDYLDASISNLNDIFVNGLDASRIEINMTPLSGMIYNLKEIMQDVKLQIVKIFRTSEIKDTFGTDIKLFDRAGVRKNITIADGYRRLGEGCNVNLPINIRSTAKITAAPAAGIYTSTTESEFESRSKGELNLNINLQNIKDSGGNKILEFTTSNIKTIQDMTELKDTTNNITYTILTKDIQTDPTTNETINLNSGEMLSTKKVSFSVPEDYQPEKAFVIQITLGNVSQS